MKRQQLAGTTEGNKADTELGWSVHKLDMGTDDVGRVLRRGVEVVLGRNRIRTCISNRRSRATYAMYSIKGLLVPSFVVW